MQKSVKSKQILFPHRFPFSGHMTTFMLSPPHDLFILI